MSRGRGLEAQFDALHGLLTDALQHELEAALALSQREEDPVPINPQLIDKIMKFLKDNGVAAPQGSPKVDRLAIELRDLDLDEVSAERHRAN